MKILKKILVLVLVLMTLSGAAVSAADANVTYSGNAGKFIFAPGSRYSLTDLFPNFKEVMPGATLTQKITVRSDADDHVKVRIYIRSRGATEEEYVPFLNELFLTVQKATDTPMFEASPDRLAGLARWKYIGTLYSGGEAELNVTLEVPTTLDDRYQDQYGEILWEFLVEELPVSPDDPVPKTGDTNDPTLWIVLTAASAAGICVLLIVYGRKKKKRVEN